MKPLKPKKVPMIPSKSNEPVDENDLTEFLLAAEIGSNLESSEASTPAILTYLDWRNYVNHKKITRPVVPTALEWATLTKGEKTKSRSERSRYNSALPPLLTVSRKKIQDDILDLIVVNRQSNDSARTGAVIRGLPTVGKTTLVKFIGKQYHRACCILREAEHGQSDIVTSTNHKFNPVVYISLGGVRSNQKTSMSNVLGKLARFYQIPGEEFDSSDVPSNGKRKRRKTISERELIASIVATARDCKTSLIIIDEISNVDSKFVGAKFISDAFKDFMNEIAATFVFCGIGDEAEGILFEWEVTPDKVTAHMKNEDIPDQTNADENPPLQTQMYYRLIDRKLLPFQKSLEEEGKALIEFLDKEIALINHEVGDLKALSEHIILRTDGFIGAMTLLIRLACQRAIRTGVEKITEELLSEIIITRAAEDSYVRAKRKAGSRRVKKA